MADPRSRQRLVPFEARHTEPMRLKGEDGNELTLTIAGYQFPEAEDPGKRFSWHMIEGEAVAGGRTWSFRYPALTCDEPARLSAWLRLAGGSAEQAKAADQALEPLEFTEPNLSFEVVERSPSGATIRVGLDVEFRPPWDQSKDAGDPFSLSLRTDGGSSASGRRVGC